MKMSIKLPSRYEDLDNAFKGRLRPNKSLIDKINSAYKSIQISGGIRFLPIYGESGSGKSCATSEISTHLPDTHAFILKREEVESKDLLFSRMLKERKIAKQKVLIAIIDQFEEKVEGKGNIPTQFIEYVSLFDRNELSNSPSIFIWLTTSRDFQKLLAEATTRNKRILLDKSFTIKGPLKREWPSIIKETFSFHNSEKSLADYKIIENDLISASENHETIGAVIEDVGMQLSQLIDDLTNFSEYLVVLLWPVTDSTRNQRILQFSMPRTGYKLNWDAFYRQLNEEDKQSLPLSIYNRARLYFDLRIIPVRAADLHRLCLNLEGESQNLGKTYLDRFEKTHFFRVISGNWNDYDYAPVRERKSQRSTNAQEWYKSVTREPTLLGKRIALILSKLGIESTHEKKIDSKYSNIRADIFSKRETTNKNKVIIELKAFAPENTMPSTIKDQIKITLKRHAQFAGFLSRQ